MQYLYSLLRRGWIPTPIHTRWTICLADSPCSLQVALSNCTTSRIRTHESAFYTLYLFWRQASSTTRASPRCIVILLTFMTSLQSAGFEPTTIDYSSTALPIETYDCSATSEEFTITLRTFWTIFRSPQNVPDLSRPFGTHRVATPDLGSSNKLWYLGLLSQNTNMLRSESTIWTYDLRGMNPTL